jgi:hypothetical protein
MSEEELKPCKHLIFNKDMFPNLELVNFILPEPYRPILAWKRQERGKDGSYYCQFCDKGNRRITKAALCYGYGDRDCYEAIE